MYNVCMYVVQRDISVTFLTLLALCHVKQMVVFYQLEENIFSLAGLTGDAEAQQ